MKVLVTGGAGFIGSEVIRQLAKKDYEIVLVDKLTYAGDMERLNDVSKKFVFYKEDICNKEEIFKIFEKEKPITVIHMAAESHVDRSIIGPEIFIETNVKGTLVMLEASKKYGVDKFINLSTDEVYGDLDSTGKFYIETPLNPSSPYSSSKAAADMLGRSYMRTYGLPVITIRPSNNYGPWQYPEKLIPVIISKVLANEKIPVYGDGKQVREWLHVSDCAKAIITIAEKAKPGDVFNVGGGNERENIFIVKNILELMNSDENLIEYVEDRLGHDFRYSLDNTQIKKKIGWEPEIDFEDGLKKTVNWYLENKDWWQKFLKDE